MIKITFPDKNIREYPEGITAMEIAKSISEGLARNVLAAKVTPLSFGRGDGGEIFKETKKMVILR